MTSRQHREVFFSISVEGSALSGLDLHYIDKLKIEDTKEEVDICEFEISDLNFEYGDVFRTNVSVEVQVGYLQPREIFIFEGLVSEPKYKGGKDGIPILKVKCEGKVKLLMERQRQKVFEDVRRSDIAQRIADEHGLDTDIEPTKVIVPFEVQAGISDAALLRRMARREDYMFKVRRNVLIFKSENPVAEPVKIFHWRINDHSIETWDISFKSDDAGRNVSGSNMNGGSGDVIGADAEGADEAGEEGAVDILGIFGIGDFIDRIVGSDDEVVP